MADEIEQSDRPVSVLMVVDDDTFDRLGSVIRHLCVGMMDEMIRVTVLSFSRQRVPDEAVGPSRVLYVPSRHWPWSRVGAAEILNLVGEDRAPVVHCLSARLARKVRPWVDEWNVGSVVHLTDLEDVRKAVTLPVREQTVFLPTTGPLNKAFQAKAPRHADRTRVLPLGIPADTEPACMSVPERIPAALVTVPLTRDCGLHLLLRAMNTIAKAGQEVQLFVLSHGPGEPLFRRLAGQLGLRDHVTFASGIRDWNTLRQALRGADFHVLPSARRRFTISTLAAMGAGLAIIAPTGTIGDYLIDGQTACLFDPQTPAQLADKWLAMLENHQTARTLGQGAQDYIREHHKVSSMVTAVADVYRRLS